MDWKHLLAYITGTVDQELLLRNYHQERPHQGKKNVMLLSSPDQDPARQGSIQCRERLGGLLKYYARDAA